MPKIISITDLKNTSTISDLCKKSSEPIFVTKNGYGDMVIMSMEIYEEKFAILDIYEKIRVAEEEYAVGKVMDASIAFKSIRDKYVI